MAAAGATVICADPSQAMLDQLPGDPALVPVRASAQDIAERRIALPGERLDAIVIKEAIYHVPASDRQAVLNGLAELLAPGGRIVIAMLPASIRYPLFTAALLRFESFQPDCRLAGIARADDQTERALDRARPGQRRRNQRGWRDGGAVRDRYHGPHDGADV
jgi:SAM-dependent methyltransferase